VLDVLVGELVVPAAAVHVADDFDVAGDTVVVQRHQARVKRIELGLAGQELGYLLACLNHGHMSILAGQAVTRLFIKNKLTFYIKIWQVLKVSLN
jgi:hypothetical protein